MGNLSSRPWTPLHNPYGLKCVVYHEFLYRDESATFPNKRHDYTIISDGEWGGAVVDVDELWREVENLKLPVEQLKLGDATLEHLIRFCDISFTEWVNNVTLRGSRGPMAVVERDKHVLRVLKADVKYPIIIADNGKSLPRVLDGRHRLLKHLFLGSASIPIIRVPLSVY